MKKDSFNTEIIVNVHPWKSGGRAGRQRLVELFVERRDKQNRLATFIKEP
jgi:hypothetical protein